MSNHSAHLWVIPWHDFMRSFRLATALGDRATLNDLLNRYAFGDNGAVKSGVTITIYDNVPNHNPITTPRCKRCGHTWTPRKTEVKMCPRCKSYYWNVAKNTQPNPGPSQD